MTPVLRTVFVMLLQRPIAVATIPSTAILHPEPLGIALVVSAWNFPICKLCGILVISL